MDSQSVIKLLLIEDNQTDVFLLREILARVTAAQITLEHASEMSAALERLSKEDFDVVLLDLKLPDMKGLESLKLLKEQEPLIPIVVTTAMEEGAYAKEAINLGAQDFLVKENITAETLSRSVLYAIERQSLLIQLNRQMEELKTSQHRFQDLVEKIGHGILLAGRDGRILLVNREAEHIIGRKRKDLLEDTWNHPMNVGVSLEISFEQPEGATVFAEMSVGAIRWEGEDVFLVTLADITAYKTTLEKLRQQSRQLLVTAEIGRQALIGHNITELMNQSVYRASQVLEVQYACILEMNWALDKTTLAAGTGWKHDEIGRQIGNAHDILEMIFRKNFYEPSIIERLKDPPFSEALPFLAPYPIVSGIATVVPGRSQIFGALCVFGDPTRQFDKKEANFLQTMATTLAAAIENDLAIRTIRDLYAPVLRFKERLLVIPLVGRIDSGRMQQLTEQLLKSIREARAVIAILDFTGVAGIAPEIIKDLLNTIRAARLLGANTIITGISTEITAQWVESGWDLMGVTFMGNLERSIEKAHEHLPH